MAHKVLGHTTGSCQLLRPSLLSPSPGTFLALSVLAYAGLFEFLSMHNILLDPWGFVQMDLPAWESLPPPYLPLI